MRKATKAQKKQSESLILTLPLVVVVFTKSAVCETERKSNPPAQFQHNSRMESN